MSSGLSGACQTAAMLAQDYEGKVFVVNNQRISVTQYQSLLDALVLIEKGYDAKAIKEKLEEDKFNCTIYIMLDTLEYLIRSSRSFRSREKSWTLIPRQEPFLKGNP